MTDRRMQLPLDPKTGFPKVPDTYYFRVGEFGSLRVFGVGLYRIDSKVSLFRKKPYDRHVLIDWRWYPFDNVSPQKGLIWAARGLWLDVLDQADMENLIGNYPPNSL